MYKQISDTVVQRLSDGAFIPIDAPGNKDCAEFLEWQDAGGQVQPVDPVPETVPTTKEDLQAQLAEITAKIDALPEDTGAKS